MLRVVGLFSVAGGSGYLAMHNGHVGGFDLTQMPIEMIGFLVVTGALIFSLRYI